MTDTPPSDCPSQGAEFDMMGALDWKDGIATLPGSDIRVRKKKIKFGEPVHVCAEAEQNVETKTVLVF